MIENRRITAEMSRIIARRASLGWSTEDHVLIQSLSTAGFSAAEIERHFEHAKAQALAAPAVID